MADQNPQEVVIVGSDGTEHVFPAGFDPKRAAAIVKGGGSIPAGDLGAKVTVNGQPFLDQAGDALKAAWGELNPVEQIKGLYQTGRHPIIALKAIYDTGRAHADASLAAAKNGDFGLAAQHTMAALVPLLGPKAYGVIDEVKAGEYGKALGEVAGFIGSLYEPVALAKGAKAVVGLPAKAGRVAGALAENKLVDVIAPKVGPGKWDYLTKARQAAPALLRDPAMGAFSRAGLYDKMGSALSDANAALDAGYASVTGDFAVKPIVDGLKAAKARLMPSGSAGTPVEMAVRADRLHAIDQAIAEIGQLGDTAKMDALRDVKKGWGHAAEKQFTPTIAPDAAKLRGEGAGYSDAFDVLREYMVGQAPNLSELNAKVTVYKRGTDALRATEETELVRPKVGRRIFAGTMGAVAGNAIGGIQTAALGAAIVPIIDATMTAGLTTKITTARLLTRYADAMKGGKIGAAQAALMGAATSAGLKGKYLSAIADAFRGLGATPVPVSGQGQQGQRSAPNTSGPPTR